MQQNPTTLSREKPSAFVNEAKSLFAAEIVAVEYPSIRKEKFVVLPGKPVRICKYIPKGLASDWISYTTKRAATGRVVEEYQSMVCILSEGWLIIASAADVMPEEEYLHRQWGEV